MLDDGSASLDSIGCVAPAAEVELEDVDSDPSASAVADAPSDDEVSGPAAASPSDVGLSAAVALGAESVAFESPESQGPGLKLKFITNENYINIFLYVNKAHTFFHGRWFLLFLLLRSRSR